MYNKKIAVDINCGFRIAIEVMGGKWKPYIIYELLDGPKRPSELQRRMPEASERVLAQQLKELMEYGVVQKRLSTPSASTQNIPLLTWGVRLFLLLSNYEIGETTSVLGWWKSFPVMKNNEERSHWMISRRDLSLYIELAKMRV